MNRETFHYLYSDIISKWPKSLDVSEKLLFEGGGFRVKNLIIAHDFIEDYIEQKFSEDKNLGDWYRLVDWTIYQLLYASIKKNGHSHISPATLISEEDVLKHCLKNEEFSSDWEGS